MSVEMGCFDAWYVAARYENITLVYCGKMVNDPPCSCYQKITAHSRCFFDLMEYTKLIALACKKLDTSTLMPL